jgi:hypothetical protein
MKKYILYLVAFFTLAVPAFAQSPFTVQELVPGCSHYAKYAPDPHAGDTLWNCSLAPATFPDGDYYVSQVVYLHPDGTFDGTFYILQKDYAHPSMRAEAVPFAGTWTGTTQTVGGPYFQPTELDGAFGTGGVGTGTVTEFFALVERGGYKGTKAYVWSLVGGTGQIE